MQFLSTVQFDGVRLRNLSPAIAGDEPLRKAEGSSGGGGGAALARANAVLAMAGSIQQTGVVTLGKASQLLSLLSTGLMRIRLYGTVAARNADLGRALGVAPAADAGLQFEGVTTSTLLSFVCAPAPLLINNESVVTTAIAYTIDPNVLQTSGFNVTLTFIAIEP